MKADYDTVVLGAGPAGTGPLMCAIQRGDHEELLERGVLWLDTGHRMVAGTLGENDILSDTASSVLLECLAGQQDGPLRAMLAHPLTDEIRALKGAPLPLPLAGRYLAELGEHVRALVDASINSAFLGGATASRVDVQDQGFLVHVDRGSECYVFRARQVVFAMGGYQCRDELLARPLSENLRLADGFADRTLTSSELVRADGLNRFARALRDTTDPRVVVLGGSHSAMTAAWLALNRSGVRLSEGSVQVFCRRLPKIFYPSRDEAAKDGYPDWSERDVCPVTGRVFRLAGLRLSARELMRSVRRLGTTSPETRLKVSVFSPDRDEQLLRSALDSAGAIVAAFGYRPRVVPVFRDGSRIALLAERDHRAPLVDSKCRLLATDGEIIDGAFGIGLASGFVPHGNLGGEPSFDGQTNGLWLYQNGVGEIILDQLLITPPASPLTLEIQLSLSTQLAKHDPENFGSAQEVALPEPSGLPAQTVQPLESRV